MDVTNENQQCELPTEICLLVLNVLYNRLSFSKDLILL